MKLNLTLCRAKWTLEIVEKRNQDVHRPMRVANIV